MDKDTLFKLLENSGSLPELPQSISEILAMLKNPLETDIDVLAEKVSQNEQLNALMLANLNSGYYHINKKLASVREAVVYLGMQAVQNLTVFFISRLLFPDGPRGKKRSFDMPRYWKHVIGTSVAGSMLSARTKQGDRYKFFTYGLIHDIGIALLDACLPDLIDEIAVRVSDGIHQLVAERSLLGGLTHAEVGAWLCRRWGIREDITGIVEHHHAPFLAGPNAAEVRLIHVADTISTMYYEKLLGLSTSHTISPHILSLAGVTETDAQAVAAALPQEVESVHGYFIS